MRINNVHRLVLWKSDVAGRLGLSVRTVDRMLCMCELPFPDVEIRGRKGWKASTIETWVDSGCPNRD